MPEIYIHQTPDVYVRVWEITESESFFKDCLEGKLTDLSLANPEFRNQANYMQYLASRMLIAEAFSAYVPIQLMRRDSRQLYLSEPSSDFFSISHTEGYAGIIKSKQPCGIDLEKVDRDIRKISHKFMQHEETSEFKESHEILKLWSAKECMFKMYGLGEVDYIKHIRIQPSKETQLHGYFNNQKVSFESLLSVNQLNNLQMVWGDGNNFVVL